jgi:hypothetical protein
MIDEYRIWVPLHPKVDLALAVPGDVPLTIWRLVLYPYEVGLRPASEVSFTSISADAGFRLGRTRTFELLSEIGSRSQNPDLQVAACLQLNETYRGCGGEGCLTRILGDHSRSLDDQQRARLVKELQEVPDSNAKLKAILLKGSTQGIGSWANSNDRQEIRRFLELLARHPDPDIARLAAQRLSKW